MTAAVEKDSLCRGKKMPKTYLATEDKYHVIKGGGRRIQAGIVDYLPESIFSDK